MKARRSLNGFNEMLLETERGILALMATLARDSLGVTIERRTAELRKELIGL